MENYYDMAIFTLPVIGALLIAWAGVIGKKWNKITIVRAIGAFLIFIPFMVDYYNRYIGDHDQNYKNNFWIAIIIIVILEILFLVAIPKIKRKVVEKSGNDIVTPNTESTNLLTDEPISLVEQDRLNRSEFAKQFAHTLMEHRNSTCLIAALHGPWGSGKSSLLNLIENELHGTTESANDYIIIRFNPWNISSLDQLIITFFHELKVKVQGKLIADKLPDTTGKLFDLFSGILTVGSEFSPVGSQFFSLGAKGAHKISGIINKSKDKSPADIKKQLDLQLAKSAKRIFILIDDIDRLDQMAIRLLFRMIRLNADFHNTTYLLAFDLKIVEALLDEEQPKYGKEYLEKIIQLPVHIPSIDEAILIDILAGELNIYVNKYDANKFDGQRWQEIITEGRFFKLFRTIRDVVRYVNGLKLNHVLVANEVDLIDFMALEAIRIFAPTSYDLIRRNKSILTKMKAHEPLKPDENIETTKKILDHIFDVDEAKINETGKIIKDICKVLFPQLGRVYANMTYNSSFEQKWRQQKRICSTETFDKYFILGIPKGEISDEEMRTTVARSDDETNLIENLNELFDRKLGKRFLELFEDYINDIPLENCGKTIIALFNIEARIMQEPTMMLSASPELQVARLIFLLLKKMPNRTERKQTIINAINQTSNIFLPVYFVSLITPDSEKGQESNEATVELEFSADDIIELHALCVQKIKAASTSSEFSKLPRVGTILFRWLRWGNADEVKEYVGKLVETDEGLLDLLQALSTEVRSSGGGRRIEISQDYITSFIDIDHIETKVKNMKNNKWDQLDERQKELIEAFLKKKTLFPSLTA